MKETAGIWGWDRLEFWRILPRILAVVCPLAQFRLSEFEASVALVGILGAGAFLFLGFGFRCQLMFQLTSQHSLDKRCALATMHSLLEFQESFWTNAEINLAGPLRNRRWESHQDLQEQ